MKLDELTVNVTAKLTISDDTAERCLRLLEMYLNDNPNTSISGGARHEDGKITPFKIERQ